jgi:glycosyltransferase involved in cell wall biosynthesis
LTKRKGIIQIIHSLVSLKDFALVVIGDGQELENLIRAANEFGVSNRCVFLGYRPNAVEYLNFFDIYVMASYSEGFPLGLLEAGLSRLPVVCSDIPIFRELFNPKEVCFFELDNDKALIESVIKCYNNKEEFASLIFKCVSSKYNITNMANNYMLLYQNK